MIKLLILFFSMFFSGPSVFSQFIIEKDIIYEGNKAFENKQLKLITFHPSFGNKHLLEKIINDFGKYNEVKIDKNGDSILTWHPTRQKKWLNKKMTLFIEKGVLRDYIKDENGNLNNDEKGNLMHNGKSDEFILIYGYNENEEDLFKSSQNYSRAKRYFEKLIKNNIKKE